MSQAVQRPVNKGMGEKGASDGVWIVSKFLLTYLYNGRTFLRDSRLHLKNSSKVYLDKALIKKLIELKLSIDI